METKYCKNKKCKRPLPEGYKHKYCENCRGKQAEDVKKRWRRIARSTWTCRRCSVNRSYQGKIQSKGQVT